MIRSEEVYKIGKLGKPHGVKGEISFMFDDDVFDRVDADYLVLDVDGIMVPFFIEEYRFKNDESVLMKFEDIDTQDKARELTGDDVYFPHSLSDSTDENVSWTEIFGFDVLDKNTGSSIGTIKSVDDSTMNTLFEIETPDGRDVLVPANENLIHEADMENRQIRMIIPDGLLDL
jgi:16S rRNA processing protein RimM